MLRLVTVAGPKESAVVGRAATLRVNSSCLPACAPPVFDFCDTGRLEWGFRAASLRLSVRRHRRIPDTHVAKGFMGDVFLDGVTAKERKDVPGMCGLTNTEGQ